MRKIIILLLTILIVLTIWIAYSIYITDQNKKNVAPPYYVTDFQSNSEPSYVRDRIIELVGSSEYKKAVIAEKNYMLLTLIRDLSNNVSDNYNYPLIDEKTISVENNRIWAIYTHPSNFYSMWVVDDEQVLQYSYSDYESWNNRYEIETVYYVYK